MRILGPRLHCTLRGAGKTRLDWQLGMDVEIVEEEIVCMETNIFGNVRPIAYSEPLKRPAHTASQAGSSNVLSFVSDQRGISSYRTSMEAAKDKELTIRKKHFCKCETCSLH